MKRASVCGVYAAKRSAQSYLCAKDETTKPGGACGSACGAGDGGTKPEPQPKPKPTACGSACGAGGK
ncbi:MAG: hypothetical protein K2L03_02330 [Bacteroidales bacterium]|nr:hypothetical protein [Bacteroidales bacterium]